MAGVYLEHVSKQFVDGTLAVDDICLDVLDGELMVLVGPSGCGKSTTLRMIAGLETPTDGDIRIGNETVNTVPAAKRNIAMVFQNYALYPHKTVYGNLSFGLKLQNRKGVLHRVGLGDKTRSSIEASNGESMSQRVQRVARELGIEHLLNKRPHQLSGGERQRVALGRAVVRNPAAFLFDEPLSNLDAKLRVEMRSQLKRLHQRLGATMIYVTHDQIEAMTLGDRIAVLNRGRIQQLDTPHEVYREPANRFVAEFMGTIPMNLIPGNVTRNESAIEFRGGLLTMDLNGSGEKAKQIDKLMNQPVVLGVRSEEIEMVPEPSPKSGLTKGVIREIDPLGDSQLVEVELMKSTEESSTCDRQNITIKIRTDPNAHWQLDQMVRLNWSRCRLHWFDEESGNRINER